MGDKPRTDGIEGVLRSPAASRRLAVDSLIATGDNVEAARALWTLGKAAHEDNRVEEARRSLERALELAVGNDALVASVKGTLGLVYMKLGQTDAAYQTLVEAEQIAPDDQVGRLLNQRGMILADQGDLASAHTVLTDALNALNESGDVEAAARTLCNLGALASMMWRLDESKTYFEQALPLARQTGQDLVLAGIQGNLGYLFGLLGDTRQALIHYESGRQGLAALDGVEMSRLVLESDAARTLLDAGLHHEAVLAARAALALAESGDSRVLRAQIGLLLAEALTECGRAEEAIELVRQARPVFDKAQSLSGVLQGDLLLARALRISSASAPPVADQLKLVEGLDEVGWKREAEVARAQLALSALIDNDLDTARSVAGRARDTRPVPGTQAAVTHAVLDAVSRFADGNTRGSLAAVRSGLLAAETHASGLGSSELRAGLSQSCRDLLQLGLRIVIAGRRPGQVLRWADRSSFDLSSTPPTTMDPTPELDALRVAVLRRETLRRSGQDTSETDRLIRLRERAVRDAERARSIASEPSEPIRMLDVSALKSALGERTLVRFFEFDEYVLAVTVDRQRARLRRIAPSAAIAAAGSSQRQSLSRLGRSGSSERILESARDQFEAASRTLGEHLQASGAPTSADLIIVPSPAFGDVSWSALLAGEEQQVTVASSAAAWLSGHPDRALRSVGFVSGPDIAEADLEAVAIEQAYASPVARAATVDQAVELLGRCELVHVAAHGTYRRDNPSFSAIRLADGPLMLADIERIRSAPSVVVLGSCQAAAGFASGGLATSGMAGALLRAGVGMVVGSIADVSSSHTARLLGDFHQAVQRGSGPVEALALAQERARERGSVGDVAAAAAFSVFGSRTIVG